MITAGDRFADVDNALTILRLASVDRRGQLGMTFVIIGGGIDLSVGALVALASVWATTLATQPLAGTPLDRHGVTALLVGAGAGWSTACSSPTASSSPFIATLAMLAAARGLAEIIAEPADPDRRQRDVHSTSSPATCSASRRW